MTDTLHARFELACGCLRPVSTKSHTYKAWVKDGSLPAGRLCPNAHGDQRIQRIIAPDHVIRGW